MLFWFRSVCFLNTTVIINLWVHRMVNIRSFLYGKTFNQQFCIFSFTKCIWAKGKTSQRGQQTLNFIVVALTHYHLGKGRCLIKEHKLICFILPFKLENYFGVPRLLSHSQSTYKCHFLKVKVETANHKNLILLPQHLLQSHIFIF